MKNQIQKKLAKKHACYVLITCDAPSEDGNMQVQMTYEGDVNLASYLLKGANQMIDSQKPALESSSSSKIVHL